MAEGISMEATDAIGQVKAAYVAAYRRGNGKKATKPEPDWKAIAQKEKKKVASLEGQLVQSEEKIEALKVGLEANSKKAEAYARKVLLARDSLNASHERERERNREIGDLRKKIEQLQRSLQVRDEELSSVRQRVTELPAILNERQDVLAEREREIEALKAKISDG